MCKMSNSGQMSGDDNVIITYERPNRGKGVPGLWNDKNVAIFVELMEAEVIKNNRTTTTFTKESWQHIKHEMNRRIGVSYDHQQLRNKFNKMREIYRSFKSLLKETMGTGFTHDPTTGRIFASDDQWKRLAVVNKHARYFQRHGCPLFGKLCVIYGETATPGEHAYASTSPPSSSDESNPVYDPKDNGVADEEVFEVKAKLSKKVEKAKGKRGREDWESVVGNALNAIANTFAESSKRITELLEYRVLGQSSSNTGSVGNGEVGVIKEPVNQKQVDCMRALNALGIEDIDKYLAAVDRITNEAQWRDSFLNMPPEAQRAWVMRRTT